MTLIDIIILAIGLALDAFAVSIAVSSARKQALHQLVFLAFVFGLFQAVMPYFGYLIGGGLMGSFSSVGHWVAFILLAGIGSRMIFEAVRADKKNSNVPAYNIANIWLVLTLAIATSVDALVAGAIFAFVPTQLIVATSVIGLVTFFLSLLGGVLGKVGGRILGDRIQIVAGIILIVMGIKFFF